MRLSTFMATFMVLALLGGAAFVWTKRAELFSRSDSDDRSAPERRPSPQPRMNEHLPPDLPLAPPGEEIEIVLAGEPADWYAMPGEDDSNDSGYRALVTEIAGELTGQPGAPEVRYDRALSRAAREVAYQTGVLGFAPPEAAVTFILHASGAPEMAASQFFTHTTSEDDAVVRDTVRRAIAGAPTGRGPLRIGVGEVFTPGQEYTRHVSVLATRRDYEIEPAARQAERSGAWTLEGELGPGYDDVKASVLYPDGRMAAAEVHVRGERFVVRAPAGDMAGTAYVDVSGTDEHGPGKIMQLAVEVGGAPPGRIRVRVPEREPEFASMDDAEAYALDLLNSDRARAGLPALAADPALAAVARTHSEDMRDHGFFAHLSPRTGLAGDRLARAGYRAMTHAENLAHNDSLGEAEASLMASVGHRRNILSPDFTHAAVGVARRQREDRTEWFVTQLFSRPVTELDADAAGGVLLERINAARRERGLGPVRLDSRISTIARGHARDVARGKLNGAAQRVIDDLAGVNASMSVAVSAIYDFATFAPPDAALAPAVNRVAIAVEQSPDDPQGRIGVIVVAIE